MIVAPPTTSWPHWSHAHGAVMARVNLRTHPIRRSRWFGAALASVASLTLAQTPIPPHPSPPPDDAEMSRAGARPASAPVDRAVLAKFDADFRLRGPSRALYEKYLPILGTAPIFDYLEGRSAGACHGEAHDLGRVLYRLRKDIGASLRECGTRCTSACMHGAVGEAFGTTDPSSIVASMNGFCAVGAMAEIHKAGNCAHGIGHALMFAAGDDLGSALNGCLYFETPGMRHYCATGVFMEFMPKRKRTADWHAPCNLYPAFAAACYRHLAGFMLADLNGDYGGLILQCQSLQGSSRLGCFHGVGGTLIGPLMTEPSLLGRVCGRGQASEQVLCIEGAIEKLADLDPAKAAAACATLGGTNKGVCLAAAKEKLYRLGKPSMPLYHDASWAATRKPLARSTKP